MRWRNGPHRYGVISRMIHWAMAVLVLGLLVLGTGLTQMQPGMANLWLYGLHKTGGITALGLVVLRLSWHQISPPPDPIGPPEAWSNRTAKTVHRLSYVLILAVPLSGWLASSATGLDVLFAETIVIPPIAPPSEAWEFWGFLAHGLLTKLLMAVLTLHVLGAIRRAWAGDGTMRRMFRG